jgi:hypothetical protein
MERLERRGMRELHRGWVMCCLERVESERVARVVRRDVMLLLGGG